MFSRKKNGKCIFPNHVRIDYYVNTDNVSIESNKYKIRSKWGAPNECVKRVLSFEDNFYATK